MGDNTEEVARIALDGEIESPASIHPGLPNSTRLVIFLGAEGRVPEVANQEGGSSVEGALNVRRGALIASAEALRIEQLHEAVLVFLAPRRERSIAFADRNGP